MDHSIEQTPKQFAKMKLDENNGCKSMARVFISNFLKNAYFLSDKEFYTNALKELDLL